MTTLIPFLFGRRADKDGLLIFSIIFQPITFSLGLWQVDRANQKTEIINSYDSIVNNPAVEFKIENDFINWQPVYLTGEFTDIILYEDNALLSGKAGFKIYHLFKTIDNSYIIIHRGFIERKTIKNDLPIIEIPKGKKRLSGTILKKKGPGPFWGVQNQTNLKKQQKKKFLKLKKGFYC